MTELNVNNYDISSYLAEDALADGKLDESELLAAINSYNTENEDNQITGDLAIKYSSSEVTLDETITDGDIDGSAATITDLAETETETEEVPEDDLESQLKEAGVTVYTGADGELIIYAETAEELAAVKEVLEANGIEYDVAQTDKTEEEIIDYLDNTLMPKYPDGVTKGTGDDYLTYMDDGIMQMSFYDEAEGTDVTYSITDANAVAELEEFLKTGSIEEPGDKTVAKSDVEKALLDAGASQEDVDANIDAVMAGLVETGYLTEKDGVYTKTDTWPKDQPGAAGMSTAMQALPEFEEMADNADIEIDTFADAFVKSLTGVDPVDHTLPEPAKLSKETVEGWVNSAAGGLLDEDAVSSIADTVLAQMVEYGYLTEKDGVYTTTDTYPASVEEINEELRSAITTTSNTSLDPMFLANHADEFYASLFESMAGYTATE